MNTATVTAPQDIHDLLELVNQRTRLKLTLDPMGVPGGNPGVRLEATRDRHLYLYMLAWVVVLHTSAEERDAALRPSTFSLQASGGSWDDGLFLAFVQVASFPNADAQDPLGILLKAAHDAGRFDLYERVPLLLSLDHRPEESTTWERGDVPRRLRLLCGSPHRQKHVQGLHVQGLMANAKKLAEVLSKDDLSKLREWTPEGLLRTILDARQVERFLSLISCCQDPILRALLRADGDPSVEMAWDVEPALHAPYVLTPESVDRLDEQEGLFGPTPEERAQVFERVAEELDIEQEELERVVCGGVVIPSTYEDLLAQGLTPAEARTQSMTLLAEAATRADQLRGMVQEAVSEEDWDILTSIPTIDHVPKRDLFDWDKLAESEPPLGLDYMGLDYMGLDNGEEE